MTDAVFEPTIFVLKSRFNYPLKCKLLLNGSVSFFRQSFRSYHQLGRNFKFCKIGSSLDKFSLRLTVCCKKAITAELQFFFSNSVKNKHSVQFYFSDEFGAKVWLKNWRRRFKEGTKLYFIGYYAAVDYEYGFVPSLSLIIK